MIDAAIRVGEFARKKNGLRKLKDLSKELYKTAVRRREAFWRAAAVLSAHNMKLYGKPIETTWQLMRHGLPWLSLEDIDWILSDGPARIAENERRLAINAALDLWKQNGEQKALLKRIEKIANLDQAMKETYNGWINPPPLSPELLKSQQKLEEIQQKNSIEQDKRDQSWIDFVTLLQKDKKRVKRIIEGSAKGVSNDLYHLWQLLDHVKDTSNIYAIDSVAPLEPMLGKALTTAVEEGLIKHWRTWKPTLKSERDPTQRNQISLVDCMGIAGVTLESGQRRNWTDKLSVEEAKQAAKYATLEINGFPKWLLPLAASNPREVTDVLMGEVIAELNEPGIKSRYDAIEDLFYADQEIIELVAPSIFEQLKKRNGLPPTALRSMLNVTLRGLTDDKGEFARFALDRCKSIMNIDEYVLYLGTAFARDPEKATTALIKKLDRISFADQKTLCERLLPHIFGGNFFARTVVPVYIPFKALERLVRIAFTTIRVQDDNKRPSGEVYSPDIRDDAEQARSAAFKQLIDTTGRATYNAILQLKKNSDCPIPPSRLEELAFNRAAADSETAPWLPSELKSFEETHEAAPRTAKDLQGVALKRLVDAQDELLHADFDQGSVLKMLHTEPLVQKWVGNWLRQKQGRAYSIERESEVADEKKPDVRFRAKASDVNVAMEIKVAESCTLEELEHALQKQLCDQYLRSSDGRYGILLLVHQKPKRWRNKRTGRMFSFAEVVDHLKAIALKISGSSTDAPQPEINVLDVSSCPDIKTSNKSLKAK